MTRTIAWMFPGQGAQAVGMGRELAEAIPACRDLFDRASQTLGWDVARVCFEGPGEDLTRSDHAQPPIFVHSLAAYQAARERLPGLATAAAAGLSSGEWAALAAAGVLDVEDALRLLQVRGRAMQEACEHTPGAMLGIIGLGAEALAEICRRSGAEIANLNSPEQTVLSGPIEAIDAAASAAAELGARRALRLNVAGAFHASPMRPAAEALEAALRGVRFAPPAFPVFSNVTGSAHDGPESIRKSLPRQMVSAVRWIDCVRGMAATGATDWVECGPGRVLGGLVRRIDKSAAIHTIQTFADLEAVVSTLSGEE